jgi:hypothetical protein
MRTNITPTCLDQTSSDLDGDRPHELPFLSVIGGSLVVEQNELHSRALANDRRQQRNQAYLSGGVSARELDRERRVTGNRDTIKECPQIVQSQRQEIDPLRTSTHPDPQ